MRPINVADMIEVDRLMIEEFGTTCERSHPVTRDYSDVRDIALLDQQGQSVSLRDLRGRPVVLVFLRWLG